jgi:hypothetical protein
MAQAAPSGAHVQTPPTHRSAAYFAPQHPSQTSGGVPAQVESDELFVELHAAIDSKTQRKTTGTRGICETSRWRKRKTYAAIAPPPSARAFCDERAPCV